MTESVRFADRREAGRRLAELLQEYGSESPVVLGLVPGGIEAAAEVARALGAELDVLVTRMIPAPEAPHAPIGAVAPSGVVVLDQPAIEALGMDPGEVDRLASLERAEMRRRIENLRGQMDLDLDGRLALLVDDGAATGITIAAAVHAARAMGAAKVVVALGVCSLRAADLLRREADALICVATPGPFHTVAEFFDAELKIDDEEITNLLEQARAG